jgi:hypothetical protein
LELRPQVHGTRPVSCDGIHGPGLGLLKEFPKVGQQFREQRNPSGFMTFVSFSLGTVDQHPATLPVQYKYSSTPEPRPSRLMIAGFSSHIGGV